MIPETRDEAQIALLDEAAQHQAGRRGAGGRRTPRPTAIRQRLINFPEQIAHASEDRVLATKGAEIADFGKASSPLSAAVAGSIPVPRTSITAGQSVFLILVAQVAVNPQAMAIAVRHR